MHVTKPITVIFWCLIIRVLFLYTEDKQEANKNGTKTRQRFWNAGELPFLLEHMHGLPRANMKAKPMIDYHSCFLKAT
jgi:hypothetical protein